MLELFIAGLVVGGNLVLITSGFAIVYATTKTFHIAHGLAYGVAGYLAWTLNVAGGLPLWLAALIALPFVALLGAAIERWVYEPLRDARASELATFTASFGLLVAGLAVVQLIWGGTTLTYTLPPERPTFRILTARVTDLQLATIATALASLVLLAWIDRRTRVGLAIKCVASNSTRAALLGVPVRRIHYLAFALGSALVVPAAVIDGCRFGLDPGRGLQVILLAMVAQLIGGVGNLAGGVVASILIGLASTLPLQWIDPRWQNLLIFAVLFIVLLVRPRGLFAGQPLRRFDARPAA